MRCGPATELCEGEGQTTLQRDSQSSGLAIPRCREAVMPPRSTIAVRAGDLDLDLDPLPQFQRVRLLERQLDEQHARVGRAARVRGAGLAGDDGGGDLLDLAAPAT